MEETIILAKQGTEAEESLGKKYIRIPLRKIKQVPGIKMNNFCVCLGKEMVVKNFAKVVKKFYKNLYKFLQPERWFCKKAEI